MPKESHQPVDSDAGSRGSISPYGRYLTSTADPLEDAFAHFLWQYRFIGRKRVLDVGSGRCWFVRAAPDRAVGLDLDQAVVEQYREEGLDIRCGNVYELPFGEGEFDGVLCSYVLEHLNHPLDALAEFHRVLRPDGYLYLTVPHPRTLTTSFFDDFTHVKPYNFRGLTMLAHLAGFSRVRCSYDLYRGPLNVRLGIARRMVDRYPPRVYAGYLRFWDTFGQRIGLVNRNMSVLEAWR